MKRTLILATLLSLPLLGLAEDKPLKERASETAEKIKQEAKEVTKTAAGAAREAWRSTKAYFSKDLAEFRAGATHRLDEIASEIDNLKTAETGQMDSRNYYHIRVQALREHLD